MVFHFTHLTSSVANFTCVPTRAREPCACPWVYACRAALTVRAATVCWGAQDDTGGRAALPELHRLLDRVRDHRQPQRRCADVRWPLCSIASV